MPYWRAYYHLVWATRSRMPLLTPDLEPLVFRLIASTAKAEAAWLYAINGMPDHVHVVLALPPTHAISPLLHRIKGSSSHFISHECHQAFRWQKGYGMFTVGAQGLEAAIEYVRRQKEHHQAGTIIDALEYYADELDGPKRQSLEPDDL